MMRWVHIRHQDLTLKITFITPVSFDHSKTRTHVRLLGPCFKTGRMKSFDRQQPWKHLCPKAIPEGNVPSTHVGPEVPASSYNTVSEETATFKIRICLSPNIC